MQKWLPHSATYSILRALTISCNMFVKILLLADWQMIAQHCKQYGQKVLEMVYGTTKLDLDLLALTKLIRLMSMTCSPSNCIQA
eukprot:CCRYP_018715-RA/>CCRYP_018715-RA protein AED:0.34 eAED:0.34 QI:0/0/0/1/0/0/2/0/83